MPTREELKKLADLRLREAEALFEAEHYNGAAYLCGYAVELAFKARICKLLGVSTYPDTGKYRAVFATHNFGELLLLAGLKGKLPPNDGGLFANWSLAVPWTPELRYQPEGTYSRQEALDILNAIRDPKDGLLRWIKKYW